MKIILRDRNQVQINSLDIPDNAYPDMAGHKPRVILIESTNACYRLVKVEGDTGYFDEVDYMKISSLTGEATQLTKEGMKHH